jgi:hypothetical protein
VAKKHHDSNDPIQDFIDIQEHRYQPGYWIAERNKGRLDPFQKSMQKVNLSCFYRTMLIFTVLGMMVTCIFSQFAGVMSHPKLWRLIILILLFLGIYLYMRKSMLRYGTVTDEKDERPPHKHP